MFRSSFFLFIVFFLVLTFFFPSLLSSLKSFIPVLLGIVMFGMGMIINLNDVKVVLKKPTWIIVTLILQFSLMPIIAFGIVNFFNLNFEIALGFFILGSCPGGTASNVIAYLCNGNVALSILSTLFSTLFSVILTPLLIFILAKENIDVNFFELTKSTFWIVFFPTISGLIFKKVFKDKINNVTNFLPKFSEFVISLIIGVILSLNYDSFSSISFFLLFGIIIHNLFGLFSAYAIASFFKYPKDVKKSIAIEVAMQNSGLGMTLALVHFSKLSALPSAIFSLWHNISAIVLVYFWKKK